MFVKMKGRKDSSLKRRGFPVKQITHKNNTNVNKVSVNEVKSLPKGFSVLTLKLFVNTNMCSIFEFVFIEITFNFVFYLFKSL